MKEKILEVQNYFADKLARGLYRVEEISEFTIKVIVDRQYKFTLWIANNAGNFSTYSSSYNFMEVKFTGNQKISGYKHASKHQKGWVDTELRDKELFELAKLREKYPEAK
jgi:hypothetical protein